jgi:hypothetical protein
MANCVNPQLNLWSEARYRTLCDATELYVAKLLAWQSEYAPESMAALATADASNNMGNGIPGDGRPPTWNQPTRQRDQLRPQEDNCKPLRFAAPYLVRQALDSRPRQLDNRRASNARAGRILQEGKRYSRPRLFPHFRVDLGRAGQEARSQIERRDRPRASAIFGRGGSEGRGGREGKAKGEVKSPTRTSEYASHDPI